MITPAQNAALMAKVVPGAELVSIPGAGHGLMYQDPQQLADVVMDFLDRMSGAEGVGAGAAPAPSLRLRAVYSL